MELASVFSTGCASRQEQGKEGTMGPYSTACITSLLEQGHERVYGPGLHPFLKAALPWLGLPSRQERWLGLVWAWSSTSPGFRAPCWAAGG